MRHVRHVSENSFHRTVAFLLRGVCGNARETESESTRWRGTFDYRGVRHGFWWGGGQDETHRKGCGHTHFVFLLLFALPCLLHLYHCSLKRSLTFAHNYCETLYSKANARMTCWSTIAQTIHCWRERHKAVKTEWAQAFGVVEADKYAKKCHHSRSADAERISKAARQERQTHVKQLFFQTPSVQPILVLSL